MHGASADVVPPYTSQQQPSHSVVQQQQAPPQRVQVTGVAGETAPPLYLDQHPAMTQPAAKQAERSGRDAVSAAPPPLPLQHQQQQQQSAPPPAQGPMRIPHGGMEALLKLPPQGPGGLPAGAVTPDGTSMMLLGSSPDAGLIAVSSSSASLSSSATAGDGNKTLYLGNLHPFVTEATLQELFAGLGGLTELKVIKDKATGVSAGYGFAKFVDTASAQAALDKVGKTVLFGQEARINWAFQKEQKEEVAHHFHVFVGDLSSDVADAMLHAAFAGCPGCSDARVMWDHATGRSRGYGFVSFRTREEAEAAIQMMHGQFVGSRRVRCGWAQHKTEGLASMDPGILDRADPTNTNVYVGNLAPDMTDAEVRRQFGAFGPIAELKLYRKGSYGFVRYKAHPDAVRAIVSMNGQNLGGKVVKCSWGRHPNTPPSGVQASLMLAAAAGISPLAVNTAGMLGHAAMASPHLGMMHGGGMLGGMGGMGGMPMAAAGAQSLIHGGQPGMNPAGMAGQPGAGGSALLNGTTPGAQLPLQVDHSQLQHHMAGMPYGLPYGTPGGAHSNMAYFGGGALH